MWPLQECDPELITCDETLLVRRYSGDVRIEGGRRVQGPYTEYEMTCMVTPVSGKDLMLVPEGDRAKDQLMVYTNNCDEPLMLLDLVQRDGWFQTQSVANWGSFSVGRIVRVDVGEVVP